METQELAFVTLMIEELQAENKELKAKLDVANTTICNLQADKINNIALKIIDKPILK